MRMNANPCFGSVYVIILNENLNRFLSQQKPNQFLSSQFAARYTGKIDNIFVNYVRHITELTFDTSKPKYVIVAAVVVVVVVVMCVLSLFSFFVARTVKLALRSHK